MLMVFDFQGIDTKKSKNDGLEKVSPLEIWLLWVSIR